MKNLTFLFLAVFFVAACNQSAPKDETPANDSATANVETPANDADLTFYGDKIDWDGAVAAADLKEMMADNSSMDLKVMATINSCCKKKGCWMKVATADGAEMRVRFKDYGFFVPKDADGHEAVFEGQAFLDTVSVEDLRHYAEDGGQSEEEIMAITEPEINVAFLANGVAIKGYTTPEDGESEVEPMPDGEENTEDVDHAEKAEEVGS